MKPEQTFEQIFSKHSNERDALIPVLQDIQEEYGYLSPEAMTAAAGFCNVSPVEVTALQLSMPSLNLARSANTRSWYVRVQPATLWGLPAYSKKYKTFLKSDRVKPLKINNLPLKRWPASGAVLWPRPWLSTKIPTVELNPKM